MLNFTNDKLIKLPLQNIKLNEKLYKLLNYCYVIYLRFGIH